MVRRKSPSHFYKKCVFVQTLHRTQIAKWRKRAIEGLGGIFQGKEAKSIGEKEKLIDELYRQIGQLKVKNEWLKKKAIQIER